MEARIDIITLAVADLDGHLWEALWNPRLVRPQE